MGGIPDYSGTAASNITVGGVSIAEGMLASGVNNALRAIMADIRDYADDIGGALTAGGTANALTLTTNSVLTSSADGDMVSFRAALDNTTSATLNVDSRGVHNLKCYTSSGLSELSAGMIQGGGHYLAQWKAGSNDWIVLNPTPVTSTAAMFSAHKNGSNQGSIAASTDTTLTFGTEAFDVGSYFASNAWTPPSGYVFLYAQCEVDDTPLDDQDFMLIKIFKDSTEIARGAQRAASGGTHQIISVTALTACDGTDAFTVKVNLGTSGNATVLGNSERTYFCGHTL
jgi:hypothetical protein